MRTKVANSRKRHFQNHTSKVRTIIFFLSENEFFFKILSKGFYLFCYDKKKKTKKTKQNKKNQQPTRHRFFSVFAGI